VKNLLTLCIHERFLSGGPTSGGEGRRAMGADPAPPDRPFPLRQMPIRAAHRRADQKVAHVARANIWTDFWARCGPSRRAAPAKKWH